MRPFLVLPFALITLLTLISCNEIAAPDDPAVAQSVQPDAAFNGSSGIECHITARGTIATGERFAGAAIGDENSAVGRWIVLTPDGHRFVGNASEVVCEQNGTLLVTIQGTGSFDGTPDMLFQMVLQDRQDPSLVDTFRIVIVTPDEDLVYSAAGLFTSGDMRSVVSP